MEHSLPMNPVSPPDTKRYVVALCIAVAALAYAAVEIAGIPAQLWGERSAVIVSDIFRPLAALFATLICWLAAQRLSGRERLCWRLIALGCAMWLLGQCVWNYHELWLGQLPRFPHWVQLLTIQYPLWLCAGLLLLPKPVDVAPTNYRRIANLALLVCTWTAIAIIVLAEPALSTQRSAGFLGSTLLYAGAYPVACVLAWYLLWSYRWRAAYWPLVLIVTAMAIHTATFILDMHQRLTGQLSLSNYWNFLSLLLVACAAYEHGWSQRHRADIPAAGLLIRERWLEATMPALMISAIVAVSVVNIDSITPRVIYLIAAVGLVFAICLGLREAWIHHEEHLLVNEINSSHRQLVVANNELSANAAQVRSLNAELEQRVRERTAALEAAYREMEGFSYAVAHDIKAPLRAINGFAALLAQEYGHRLDERAHSHIERVRNGALHMAQLVDDLLEYARVDRAEMQKSPLALRSVIDTCVAEQAEAIGQSGAQVDVSVDSVSVEADPAALSLVLRNLLQNALKFSHGADPPRIQINAQRANGAARIAVSDNGIGFDMQYHDRIFALFQRLHRADQFSGTGIGLAIARKAVERMGGKVWAESSPGLGATFYVDLPAAT